MTDMTTPDPLKLARDALAPCPFCGNRPYLTVRPDNAEATTYFAAVACFCGGYSACAHKMATAPQADEAETLARTAWNRRAAIDALPASVPSGEPAAKKPHGCEHLNGQFCGKAGPCLYPQCAPTVPAAPAPAPPPDAQALQQARWEGIQSVQVQTAEIVRAALELLDSVGEGLPPDALAAFKRVFGGAAPAVAAPEPLRWQPIETAPKDGTMFLCWVSAVRYGETDEGQQYQQDASQIDFCWWRPPFDGVPDSDYFDNASGQVGDSQAVTHWMPLPAAPAAQEPQHG